MGNTTFAMAEYNDDQSAYNSTLLQSKSLTVE